MENIDKVLVDEFDKLQQMKKDLDNKIDEIRNNIIIVAKQKNTDLLFGTHKKCLVKEYQKIIYPEDKKQITELLTKKGLYDKFSSVNYFKLTPRILKNEIDLEIINLVKKEKGVKVSLIDMGI